MAEKIYIIEDDASLRDELSQLLELQGFAVEAFRPSLDAAGVAASAGFAAASDEAVASNAHCVLLDLKLPGASGHAICKDIRAKSDVSIIVLTSSESEFDEVMAMNLGADDYATKPYSPAVLIAHIQSALRRRNASFAPQITHGGVALDIGTCKVSFEGESVDLTRNEIQILRMLMESPGIVLTRSEIMCALWESDAFVDDNTLTVNINRLRKKLSVIGVSQDYLVTHRGIGYSIDADV